MADFYTNTINKSGVACDPDTGRPIPCTPGYKRAPSATYRGRTAKEMQVRMVEGESKGRERVRLLDHAMYLGREFVRAEMSLLDPSFDYVQD